MGTIGDVQRDPARARTWKGGGTVRRASKERATAVCSNKGLGAAEQRDCLRLGVGLFLRERDQLDARDEDCSRMNLGVPRVKFQQAVGLAPAEEQRSHATLQGLAENLDLGFGSAVVSFVGIAGYEEVEVAWVAQSAGAATHKLKVTYEG